MENEQGEVVREFMKDTDAINMYKSMRETLGWWRMRGGKKNRKGDGWREWEGKIGDEGWREREGGGREREREREISTPYSSSSQFT